MNRPKLQKNGLPENIRINNGAYCVRYTEMLDGKRVWRQKKLVRVVDGLPAMYEAITHFYGGNAAQTPAPPDMPIRIAEFCKWYFPTLTPDVQREYVRQYKKIADSFADFDVELVQKKDCIAFLEDRCKPGSRIMQAYKSRLLSFFRWCADRGYRTDNPATDIRLKGPPKNNRYPTDAEYHAIRDALLTGNDGRPTPSGPMIQCFMDLCYLTMQRTTEIRLLKWSQDKGDHLDFRPSKTLHSTGQSVSIPITVQIRACLERARAIGTVKGMYVIHQRDGAPYNRSGILSAWTRACLRAGVDGVTTRHLRPKAATDAKRYHSMGEIQIALAHSSGNTTEGYIKQFETPVSSVLLEIPKRGK